MKINTIIHIYLLVFISILSDSLAKAQCISGWNYDVPIVVVNNTASNLTNFQVKIVVNTASLVSAGKMIKTGDDIRFTDSGTCAKIPYWIESGMNSSSTVIWIKMPVLPGSAHRTIKMYYGNSSASAQSNGDSTFLIFDDFLGSSLNSSKWSTYSFGANNSVSVSGGILTTAGGNSTSGLNQGSQALVSKAAFQSPIFVESLVTGNNGYYTTLGMLDSGTLNGYSLALSTYSSGANYGMNLGEDYSSSYFAGYIYSTNWYAQNSSASSTLGIWQVSWPSTGSEYGSWPGGYLTASASGVSLSKSVQVTLGNIWTTYGYSKYDWVRARKYANSDASSTIGSEENNAFIKTGTISKSLFCANDSIKVPFSFSGSLSFNSGNTFTAQLSDSSGSFSSPTNIGTLSGTSAGTISGRMPSSATGSHYLVRVISSNPVIIGSTNGSNLSVPARAKPSYSLSQAYECFNNNSFVATNQTSGAGSFTYKWHFGDGDSSTATNPKFSYTAPGTYSVKLIAINTAGCSDSVSQILNVYPQITSKFSVNNTTQCFKGQSFAFTDKSFVSSGSVASWGWDFGDNNSSVSQNPVHTYSKTGSYKVILTPTSNTGCTDTFSIYVDVIAMPVAGFSVNSSGQCFTGNSFNFSNTSTGSGTLDYKWKLGDGNTSNSATLIHSYASDGNYTVSLYATNSNGCIDSTSQVMVIYPKVKADFSVKANQCFKQQNFSFINTSTVGSGSMNYKWDFGDTSTVANAINPLHNYQYPGKYKAKLITTSDKGCTDSFSELMVVNPTPNSVIQATGKLTLCEGESVALFSNPSAGLSYVWERNANVISGAVTASYIVSTGGNYEVVLINSAGCSDTSTSLKVIVNPLPNQPVITENGRVLTTDNASSYQWYVNDSTINGADSISYKPNRNSGIFSVTITDNNGCSNTSFPFYFDKSGIQDHKSINNIKIYPNPAHNRFTIDLTNSATNVHLAELLDINGKVIEKYNIPDGRMNYEFPLTTTLSGVYLLRLTGSETTIVAKLIVY